MGKAHAATLALVATFVLIPSLPGTSFNGLPFDHPPAIVLIVLLGALAASGSSRREAFAALGPAGRRGLVALAVVGIALKLVLVARGGYPGFLACYRGGADAATRPCDVSYDNPFARFGATRVDPQLWFDGATWRLGLLNNRHFDMYRDNAPVEAIRNTPPHSVAYLAPESLIDHFVPPVPFFVSWRTSATSEADASLHLGYVGTVAITIDGAAREFPAEYAARGGSADLPLSTGTHEIVVNYRFDVPPAEQKAGPWPVTAMLHIDAPDGVRWGTATRDDVRLARLVDLLGLACLALLIVAVARAAGADAIRATALVGVAVTVAMMPVAGYGRDKLLELLIVGGCVYWIRRDRFPLPLALATLTALCLIRVAWGTGPAPGIVHYRYWGDDGLTYESFAREILRYRSLEAGEEVFRGQPLFRYIRFGERLLVGEDEWLIVAGALVLFNAAYSWLGRRVGRAAPQRRTAALGATALLLWIVNGLTGFVESGMTEYPTWMLLPLSMGLLFLGQRRRDWLIGAALMGVGVLDRFNQAPAYALLLLVFGLRSTVPRPTRADVFACLGVAALVATVPLISHNYWYAGQWRLVPDSAQINLDFPLGLWSIDPRGAWAMLGRKLEYLLHMGVPEARSIYLPLHALQATIVAALAAVLAGWLRPFRWHLALFAAPAVALAVHIFFAVHVYYPRHIMFGYLLAGVIVLVLLGEDGVSTSAGLPMARFTTDKP